MTSPSTLVYLPGALWALVVGFVGTLITIFEWVLFWALLGARVEVKGLIYLLIFGAFLVLSAVFTYRMGFLKGAQEMGKALAHETKHPGKNNPFIPRPKGSTVAWILVFGLVGLTFRAFYQLGRYRAYWEKWKAYRVKSLRDRAREEKESWLREISRLAELHQQGALTDEEFAKAKAQLLK